MVGAQYLGAFYVLRRQEIKMVKSSDLGENLALLLPLWMPLGKSLHFFELQFSHPLEESK